MRNIPLLCLYLMLLSLPCGLGWRDDSFCFEWKELALGFVASCPIAALAYSLAQTSKWVRRVVSTILWILFLIELFVFAHFHSRLTDRILFLVMQTDGRECSEFLSSYLPQWQSLIPIAACVVVWGLYAAIRRKIRQISRFIRKRRNEFRVISILAILTGTGGDTACLISPWVNSRMAKPTIVQSIKSVNAIRSYGADISRLEESMDKSDGKPELPLDSLPDIVFVIGESFNPHHSSLYGYPLPTTPRMQQEVDRGLAVAFRDAVTPSAATAKMSEILMSPASADGDTWDFPLTPTLFKKAGYYVALHDNQATRTAGDLGWDIGNGSYLNSSKVEQASFDYRNTRLHSFDMEFAKAETETMQNHSSGPRFDIFHLMGQHKPADRRMPTDWDRVNFDYSYRPELTRAQIGDLCNYDNATLYNDSVMSVILNSVNGKNAVVVYVSDHGEEVHDFRNQYGRTMEPISKGIARNVYEVPLIVFFTPEFRRMNPDVCAAIEESSKKAVYTGDIGQMLLSLGRISTRYYDATRDPLSSSYSSAGRRIMNFETDYDSMYQ